MLLEKKVEKEIKEKIKIRIVFSYKLQFLILRGGGEGVGSLIFQCGEEGVWENLRFPHIIEILFYKL